MFYSYNDGVMNTNRFCVMIIAAMLAAFHAKSYDFLVEKLGYTVNSDGISVTLSYSETIYSSSDDDNIIEIPSHVEYNNVDYKVTAIGENAFNKNVDLNVVIVPNSVSYIAKNAFVECDHLKSIAISSSVSLIDNGAVAGCSRLEKISIDPGNPIYDSRDNCNAIIETASNTLVIGCRATVIPESVVAIGDSAFYACDMMPAISIPNSVTSIGNMAFLYCNALSEIVLPSMLTHIGDWAFYNCTNLQSVSFPTSLKELGIRAFSECKSLKEIRLPNSLQEISDYAFYNCTNLETVEMPLSLRSIGQYAFTNCTSLKELFLPNSVTKIGRNCFFNCYNIATVNIPPMLTKIPESCFQNDRGLTSIVIPNTVRRIESNAFRDCKNLSSLIIEANKNLIVDATAFSPYVENYTNQMFGVKTLSLIGSGDFNFEYVSESDALMCTVEVLNIGSEITSVGKLMAHPKTINCFAAQPPVCNEKTFTQYNAALHVPTAASQAYFTADVWKNFSNVSFDANQHVDLNLSEASLMQWEQLSLAATVSPADSELNWSTSDACVARVDNGKVTAVGGGECIIYVSLASNPAVYDICKVKVSYPEIALGLSATSLELNIGEQAQLAAIITPDNTGLIPEWSSSDETVATVDNGVVKAMKEGECEIFAKVLDKTVSCRVVVSGQAVISFNVTNVRLKPNQLITILPSCTPDYEIDFVVSSSNSDVALARIVERNVTPTSQNAPSLAGTKAVQILGISPGEAVITLSSADGNVIPAKCYVNVTENLSDGDIDGSQIVDVDDVNALINLILSYDDYKDTYPGIADLNGDGLLDVDDVNALINMILAN